MKAINLTGIAFLTTCLLAACDSYYVPDGDGEDHFVRFYGGSAEQFAAAIDRDAEGYFLLGSSNSFAGNRQVLLIRTDLEGIEGWSARYGDEGEHVPTAMGRNSDGDLLLTGYRRLPDRGIQGFVVQVPATDHETVEPTYFGASTDSLWFHGLSTRPGGGCVLVGETSVVDTSKPGYVAGSADRTDMIVLFLDGSLNEESRRVIGFESTDCARFIQADGDEWIVGGESGSLSAPGLDPVNVSLFRLDGEGAVKSVFAGGTTSDDRTHGLLRRPDRAGFVLLIESDAVGGMGLLETDFSLRPKGPVQAIQPSPAVASASSGIDARAFTNMSNGRIGLLAEARFGTDLDFYLAELQAEGLAWIVARDTTLGFTVRNYATAVLEPDDGGLVFTGSHEFGLGNVMISLIKTGNDDEGYFHP